MEYIANKNIVAQRIAGSFKTGEVINLGIGLPTLVQKYIPQNVSIALQSEIGMMGIGPTPAQGHEDRDLKDAGGSPVTVWTGACFFDSAASFGIIRGGHVDYSILGVLEVDQEGNLANYKVPGKMVPAPVVNLICNNSARRTGSIASCAARNACGSEAKTNCESVVM